MGVLPNSPAVSVNQNQVDAYLHSPTKTDLQLPKPPFFYFLMENNEEVVANVMTAQHGFNYLLDFPNMIQPLPQQNVVLPLLHLVIIMNYGNEKWNLFNVGPL